MRVTAMDLTAKIEANRQDYEDAGWGGAVPHQRKVFELQCQSYRPGAQVVCGPGAAPDQCAFGRAAEMINDKIDEELGDSADDVREANKDGADLLKEAISFPIGLTMMAQHVQDVGTRYGVDELGYWEEEVTLGVDMVPDHLNPLEPYPGESYYSLKLRNINLLGPTGVYVMPSLNPWVCTINSWFIEVEGDIVGLNVQDVDNEVHPNPIFGHEAQIYKREVYVVRDPVNNRIIGRNTPISFSFITGTFIEVPPGKITGIGDKPTIENPNPYLEESKGWFI